MIKNKYIGLLIISLFVLTSVSLIDNVNATDYYTYKYEYIGSDYTIADWVEETRVLQNDNIKWKFNAKDYCNWIGNVDRINNAFLWNLIGDTSIFIKAKGTSQVFYVKPEVNNRRIEFEITYHSGLFEQNKQHVFYVIDIN